MLKTPEGESSNANYVWDVENQQDFPNKQDLIAIIRECRDLARKNKILNLSITNGQLTLGNLIRVVELVGRFGLYNIKFDQFKLKNFPARAIPMLKNPKFVSFWFFELLGDSINPSDPTQMEKVAAIIACTGPSELTRVYYDHRTKCITAYYGTTAYTIKLDPSKEEAAYLFSFSLETREGAVKFYLCENNEMFTNRTIPLQFNDNSMFICTYGNNRYIRHPKISAYFDQTNYDKSIVTLVPDGRSADLISLAEYDQYVQSHKWDDPEKGFGTRPFYYNEADAINKNLFPSNVTSFKVLTMINNDEVAIHETPKKFYKKPVAECERHVKQMVRVPRILSLKKERIGQLLSDHTITIQKLS